MEKPKIVSLKDASTPTVDVPPLPSEPQPQQNAPQQPLPQPVQEAKKQEHVVLPTPPVLPSPAGSPPWIAREVPAAAKEEKEDELASELTQPKIVSVQQPTLVKEYQEQAARDILPPKVEPAPLMMQDERERAKALAREIHEHARQEGFLSRVKRFFRLD